MKGEINLFTELVNFEWGTVTVKLMVERNKNIYFMSNTLFHVRLVSYFKSKERIAENMYYYFLGQNLRSESPTHVGRHEGGDGLFLEIHKCFLLSFTAKKYFNKEKITSPLFKNRAGNYAGPDFNKCQGFENDDEIVTPIIAVFFFIFHLPGLNLYI